MEFTFTVFPEPAAFVEPREGTLNHPAFGDHGKGVECTAFSNFDGTAEDVVHAIGKVLSRIAGISQHRCDISQAGLVAAKRCECARSVGDIRGGDVNRMRQALRIDREMALDTRYLLAAIVAFLFRGIRVLHTLSVNDDEAGGFGPPTVLSHRANHIFLRPPPRGCGHAPVVHSIAGSSCNTYAISETLAAPSAIGSRS